MSAAERRADADHEDPRQRGCALVTGGSRGIGAAVSQRLQSDGWRVATLSRSSGDVRADVGDPQAVAAAFEAVQERFGPVLVLVNNAGIREDGLAIRMSDDAWDSVLTTNLSGAFHCTRSALPSMMAARWGRIVNVSSVVAERGNSGQANYAASKAGMLGLTRTIAREMARRGITCNAVTPGLIETDMTAEGVSEQLLSSVPAGRFGQPHEVAATVAFLCSAEAAYVNGATISVDGALGA
jgi:3-oxoacyl-[acyl-carrier protein] reductase